MRIAAAVNEQSLDAIIPEKLEDAKGLLIVESDTMQIEDYITERWAEYMDEQFCEILLCGDMYDAALFDDIADRGITRNYAAGMPVKQAVIDVLDEKLRLITDYVGGDGCGSHSHEHMHSHGECSGDCSSCDSCI